PALDLAPAELRRDAHLEQAIVLARLDARRPIAGPRDLAEGSARKLVAEAPEPAGVAIEDEVVPRAAEELATVDLRAHDAAARALVEDQAVARRAHREPAALHPPIGRPRSRLGHLLARDEPLEARTGLRVGV